MLSFINTKCNLLILGLHEAGKSTLLSWLKDGSLVQHTPTNHPCSEEFTFGKVTFEGYDLGGHILVSSDDPRIITALRFWRRYIPAVKGIVFIAYVSDSQSLPEARQELNSILADEDVSDVPVLDLGKKVDKRGCYGQEQLIKELGINQHLSNSVSLRKTMKRIDIMKMLG
ncbi:SAR1 [Mytilus coruscus]|uniref:small monomeric GTPase n=1 Tax=Mytilus coruscus TaxID=42192 RepID=A0A6J8D5D2_MYTCO|nr:SAR1 [Mytilus coruscus]